MKNETVTVVLDAPRDDVYAFVSDVRNLPAWATEFARELRFEDGRPKVVNGLGEFWVRIDADPATGVIDMRAGADPDELALFPTRVVELPGRRCAFTFTMFQQPGMPDELFAAQHASLVRELEGVRARFRA